MKKSLLTLFTIITLPLSAYSQEAFYLSGVLGLGQADINNSNISPNPELTIGARAGLLFNDHVSAGIFALRYSGDSSNSSLSHVDTKLTPLMAEVNYYFNEADENTFWLGGLLGITQTSVTIANIESTDSETSVGASLGYHFMVAPNFAISPQVTYIKVLGDTSSSSDASITSILASLTFWL